jgi:hypothetical protein
MWVVVHLYAGLGLGLLPLPYWTLVLIALASHLFLDVVPHWDYTNAGRLVLWGSLDFGACLLTVVVGFLGFGAPLRLLALGMLAAAPDFDVLVRAVRHGRGEYWWPGHRPGFPHGRTAPLPGIATQAVVVIAAALALALH